MPEQIVLQDYDPAWPGLFGREAERIASALGSAALSIEHVGSTSVPRLAAKPIIDVVLVVADSAREETYVPALERAGYEFRLREPEFFEHRLLKKSGPSVNLHVFSQGSPEVERMVAFRDRLRADPADRRLYERTKRDLAQKEWASVQDYADAKATVVEDVLARAARPG